MLPIAERVLLQVWWTDCTNVAGGWHDADDLGEFATNGAWECSNTGWLVHEDEKCYVLAARMTDDGKNAGLIERIPKSAVTATHVHAAPVRHADHDPALPCRPALGHSLCYPVPAGEQLIPWREVLSSDGGDR